jgi:hypothetical protein
MLSYTYTACLVLFEFLIWQSLYDTELELGFPKSLSLNNRPTVSINSFWHSTKSVWYRTWVRCLPISHRVQPTIWKQSTITRLPRYYSTVVQPGLNLRNCKFSCVLKFCSFTFQLQPHLMQDTPSLNNIRTSLGWNKSEDCHFGSTFKFEVAFVLLLGLLFPVTLVCWNFS